MQDFACHVCQHLIFFENVQCLRCERALGYLPDVGMLSALEPFGGWGGPARHEREAAAHALGRDAGLDIEG